MDPEEFNPVFVCGAGRSGTTLLRSMLACHSRLFGTNEFKHLENIGRIRRDFSAKQEISRVYRLDEAYLDNLFGLFISALLTPALNASGKPRLVEKTPHNVLVMDVLGRIFPRSKFIHVIRDGRDVVCSLLTMNWFGFDGRPLAICSDAGAASSYWNRVVSQGTEYATLPYLKDRVVEVRYEALVEDPRDVLSTVLSFIDEPWEDAVLDQQKRSELVTNEIKESSTDQVKEAIHKKPIGRWKNDLALMDRELVETNAGSTLRRLGYTKDDAWWSAG